MKNVQFAAIIAVMGIMAVCAACDNGGGTETPPPTVCKCPNGTVHTDAPCDCDGQDCNCTYEEQSVATTYDLTFGDIKITLHYQKKPSEPVPAYIDRIHERFDAMANTADVDSSSTPALLINSLKNRGGNYSINVIYGSTPFDEFVATDGQTLKAHDSWLTANATTITNAQLRTAFQAMLALPAIDENGVPYTAHCPIPP